MKALWHRIFGHPRPWLILDCGMVCSGCGEQMRSF